jgi:GAF domain-containing protein
VVGLLVVVRKAPQPFSNSNQALLEAVADYASISMVNLRLFRAVEERARAMQMAAENAQSSERAKDEALRALREQMTEQVEILISNLKLLVTEGNRNFNTEQNRLLRGAMESSQSIKSMLDTSAASMGVK